MAQRPPAPDEAELSVRALQGDRAAWEVLIARHNRSVTVALVAHGVPLVRAKELAQDTWVRLLSQQSAGRLREIRLPALAIRQALLLMLEAARAKRVLSSLDEPESEELASNEGSPEDQLLHRARLEKAAAALAECSSSAQKVFARIAAEPDVRHAQVAQELGLSVQRVRQILCEVRKRLRVAVDEEEEGVQHA